MQILDPIARGNATDTTNGCQIEKDLNRNEPLNPNLE